MSFSTLASFMPLLLQGVQTTVFLWLAAGMISLLFGAAFGILRCHRMRIPVLSLALDAITFILRGIPFYVQLLLAYFVLPNLLKINLSPILAGVLALGFCSAAYTSQMVRAGINSLMDEQWESALVLGLKKTQTLQHVIMPQMVRAILPTLGGELDMLLKSTSIISAIGVLELTRAGMNIIASEMQVVSIYMVIALMYLAISSLLNVGLRMIERKYAL